MRPTPILTVAQDRILRAARNTDTVHVNARSRTAVQALGQLGLVTFETKRVSGRTIKGRTEIVVRITPAGERYFRRDPIHYLPR